MKTVAPLQLMRLCCLLLASMVTSAQKKGLQRSSFLSASVGDNITLHCVSGKDNTIAAKVFWFKQSLGLKPEQMSSFLKYDEKGELHGEFHGSNRFKLDNDNDNNDLYINDIRISDSAVYHCVRCFLHQIEFLETITVIVKSLEVQAEIYQSPYEEVEPGRSMTLKCDVHLGNCDGQHRVHWFKQSGESAPGVLYSHGGGDSDRCERNTEPPIKSCDYDLFIHNVSSEQTGTYYCAVATCGHVLFGNGTEIKLKELDLGLYILSGALGLCSVLVVVLAFSLYRMKKKFRGLCAELKCQSRTAASTPGQDVNPEQDHLNYAALSIHPSSRRQRFIEQTDCVYSSVQD